MKKLIVPTTLTLEGVVEFVVTPSGSLTINGNEVGFFPTLVRVGLEFPLVCGVSVGELYSILAYKLDDLSDFSAYHSGHDAVPAVGTTAFFSVQIDELTILHYVISVRLVFVSKTLDLAKTPTVFLIFGEGLELDLQLPFAALRMCTDKSK